MSDIFISYSSADRERARVFAQALEARGWSVWWDREIPPGRAFDDVIEEALDAARCVVVLWSKASTASSWVRNEASYAMGRKVLIPALIDADVKIPLEFRRLQAADLSRWHGEDSAEFRQFCDAVARNVAAPPGPRVDPPPPPIKSNSARNLWIGGAIALLVLAGIASLVSEQDDGLRPNPTAQNGGAPSTGFTPSVTTAPVQGAALGTKLSWRDNALGYVGVLTWDGRSPTAQLSVDVFDGGTRPMGHWDLLATGRMLTPTHSTFSTQITVNGDSQTAGVHTHNINLVFEQQPGGTWQFVRNCGDLGNPSSCYEAAR
jgi:TIR domain